MAYKSVEAVIDIETAPYVRLQEYKDLIEEPKLATWRKKKETNKKAKKPELKSQDPLTKWATGQVCCVGLNYLDSGAYVKASLDEKKVLEWTYDILSDEQPSLYITFRGEEFDLPFLLISAASHDIPLHDVLPGFRNRYNNNHCDVWGKLCKWKINASLAEFAFRFGCSDLLYGDGSMVMGWFNEGRFDEIEKHCRGDVLATGFLFKKLRRALT